jgi:hypothetical protein
MFFLLSSKDKKKTFYTPDDQDFNTLIIKTKIQSHSNQYSFTQKIKLTLLG